jgi:hypothetical protein
MRYQQLASFFKHLRASSPDHFCPIYLIICEDAFERRQILKKAASLISKEMTWIEEVRLDQVIAACYEPSLFSPSVYVGCDYPQPLIKKEEESLLRYLQSKMDAVLLIATDNIKHWKHLITSIEKEGVVLELTGKIEDRMRLYLQAKAKKEGKRISDLVMHKLLDFAGKDFASLVQEFEKLILYTGDKAEISLDDLKIISKKQHALWVYSDQVIWSGNLTHIPELDPALFFPLLSLLRTELRLGIKLCEAKKNPDVLKGIKLWPSLLKKRQSQAASKGQLFFKRALISLFDIECLAKEGHTSLDTLFTMLLAKFQIDALPTA